MLARESSCLIVNQPIQFGKRRSAAMSVPGIQYTGVLFGGLAIEKRREMLLCMLLEAFSITLLLLDH